MVDFLAITCGGTGGHFYPGLSVARAQQARGGRVVLLLGGKNSAEQSQIAARYNVPSLALPIMPSPSLRRPMSCWRFLCGLLKGTRTARRSMQHERPQVLLGMGSFASLPAIWAAHRLGIPIVLHDGNARIGKANRLLSRYAEALGTAFPAVNASALHCPCQVTGMPLRPELQCDRLPREQALAALNGKYNGRLTADRFTILLFGGSQGARKLNRAVGTAFRKLTATGKKWQLIHLTGAGELNAMNQFWQGTAAPVLVLGTLPEMNWAYDAADVVVARSGGSSAAELNAFGKYALVVPYPFASEGHQTDNAQYLAGLGAAEVVDNENLTPELAERLLLKFASDPVLRERGVQAAQPDAWDGSAHVLAMLDRAIIHPEQ